MMSNIFLYRPQPVNLYTNLLYFDSIGISKLSGKQKNRPPLKNIPWEIFTISPTEF